MQGHNHKGSVLLVNGDSHEVGEIASSLNNEGYRVLAAPDEMSAEVQVRFTNPDLVLIEAYVPGTDGFEICRKLKAEKGIKELPIIMVLTDETQRSRVFEAGAVDYVMKPYSRHELNAHISTQLHLLKLKRKLEEGDLRLRKEIDERVRLGQALQYADDDLEHRVALRTAELSKENMLLQQQLEALRSADLDLRKALNEAEVRQSKLMAENVYMREEMKIGQYGEQIAGRSRAMSDTLSTVSDVALSDEPVLITGEVGTGKALIARAIHRGSSRRKRPLVGVNCSVLSAEDIEIVLFGRENDGPYSKVGRFEFADSGTVFLYGVSGLPLAVQDRLIGFLETGVFTRVNGQEPVKSDVRVVAATHDCMKALVASGRFRDALHQKLAGLSVTLPPLRKRLEDLPLLIHHFVDRAMVRLAKKIEGIDPEVESYLAGYKWPGNARELKNVLERAVILTESKVLDVELMRRVLPL